MKVKHFSKKWDMVVDREYDVFEWIDLVKVQGKAKGWQKDFRFVQPGWFKVDYSKHFAAS